MWPAPCLLNYITFPFLSGTEPFAEPGAGGVRRRVLPQQNRVGSAVRIDAVQVAERHSVSNDISRIIDFFLLEFKPLALDFDVRSPEEWWQSGYMGLKSRCNDHISIRRILYCVIDRHASNLSLN